ncbi:MAG: hypothetical protein IPJ73_10635 [Zoogloea sp.]|nr:hypothetical protein [Zoogloea sp.]
MFLPPMPEQADPLALMALLLVAGLLAGEGLYRMAGLSRIVGYVLAGALAGPGHSTGSMARRWPWRDRWPMRPWGCFCWRPAATWIWAG